MPKVTVGQENNTDIEICACEQWKVKSGQDNEFISRFKGEGR